MLYAPISQDDIPLIENICTGISLLSLIELWCLNLDFSELTSETLINLYKSAGDYIKKNFETNELRGAAEYATKKAFEWRGSKYKVSFPPGTERSGTLVTSKLPDGWIFPGLEQSFEELMGMKCTLFILTVGVRTYSVGYNPDKNEFSFLNSHSATDDGINCWPAPGHGYAARFRSLKDFLNFLFFIESGSCSDLKKLQGYRYDLLGVGVEEELGNYLKYLFCLYKSILSFNLIVSLCQELLNVNHVLFLFFSTESPPSSLSKPPKTFGTGVTSKFSINLFNKCIKT